MSLTFQCGFSEMVLLFFFLFLCDFLSPVCPFKTILVKIYIDNQRIAFYNTFCIEMHEKGVFNLDMNPGNVFFYKSGEKYRFALIDINRIRFCRHLTRNDCVEVFKHLDNLPPPALSVVLVRYAELRQWNPQILCGAVMLRQGVNLPRRIKTGFRSLLSHLGLRK